MSIFNKHFDNINESDLNSLIDQSVVERQNLEYKSESYKNSDNDKREMLRDIASMANAYGGYIIIGIKEGPNNEGIPIEILGIENAEHERDRINQICISCIEPRISGLKIKTIKLNNNKSVLVIFIPRSIRAPHLILKGLNQFWIRHDRQKSPMSVNEIQEGFLRAESITQNIQDFLQNRTASFKKLKEPFYIIGTAPLLIRDEIIDITDNKIRKLLQEGPIDTIYDLNFGLNYEQARPSLHGLTIGNNLMTIELFRNGYLELRISQDQDYGFCSKEPTNSSSNDNKNILNQYVIVGCLVNFFRLLRAIKEYLGIDEQSIAYVSLLNIKNFGLRLGSPRSISYYHTLNCWKDNNLEINPLPITFNYKNDSIAKNYANRIWQAFGYENSPYFDDKNNFIEPN